MYFIQIYNFVEEIMKEFEFATLLEAEQFASNYSLTEDEEISISNGIFGMDWIDYLSFGCRF